MVTHKMVDEFFAQRTLALVRVSCEGPKGGFSIDTELKARGYTIYLVYPGADSANIENCYAKVGDLPESVGGVIIVVPPAQTEDIVRQVADTKITRVWMQHGSESKAAIQFCEEKGITVVHGHCIMMFADPVKSFHRFHRWVWKLLGLLPK